MRKQNIFSKDLNFAEVLKASVLIVVVGIPSLFCVVGVLLWSVGLLSQEPPQQPAKSSLQLVQEKEVWLPERVRRESYSHAANAVKANLLNPPSAKFPAGGSNGEGVVVSKQEDSGIYVATINSFVESTNVFNATVRSKWSATVTFDPSKEEFSRWSVDEVTPDRSNAAFQSE